MNFLFNNRLVSISSKILIGCFVVLAYGLIQGHSASAATSCTFASIGTSAWSTAGNWTCNDASHNVPTSTVNAIIPIATSTSLSVDSSAKSVTIGAGSTLTFNSHNLSVAGNWADSGTIVPGTGIVTFNGSVAQSIAAEANFYDLHINNSGATVTLTGNTTTTHDFAILAGGDFSTGALKLSIGRNYANGSGTLGGTGTVEFDGAAAQSISTEPNFNNLLIRSAGTVTLTGDVFAFGTLVTKGGVGTLDAEAFNLRIAGASTIGTGTTVTSTSGAMRFEFTVTNAGSIGSISGDKQFDAVINNTGGVLDVGSGYTTTTNFSAVGTVNGNSGTLVIGTGGWAVGGTFNRGTGTVKYGGSTNTVRGGYAYNNLIIDENDGSSATADANVTVHGTYRVVAPSSFNLTTHSLAVSGTTLNLGTTTSTSGTLTFTGATINSGSIGSIDGNKMFGSTLANSGVLDVGSGVATSTGTLDNSGGIINGNSGRLELVADYVSPSPSTFNAGTGTVRIYGAATQSIRGLAFNNLEVIKSGASVATITDVHATVAGTLTTSGSGTLATAAKNLTVSGISTIGAGTTVTSTSGTLSFLAAATNNGSIGSSIGNESFGSTLDNNGTLDVGQGTTLVIGNLTNGGTGVINGGNSGGGGSLEVRADYANTGTFNAQSGTFKISGTTVAQSIKGEAFNKLEMTKTAGVATITSNATVAGTLITSAASGSGTLDTQTRTLTVTGISTIGSNTTVTSTTGVLTFDSAVTNAGSIGSVSGDKLFSSTLANSGTLVVGSGAATSTGSLTNTGNIKCNTGKLVFGADYSGAGTFTANTCTVTFYGTANQSIRGVAFYNLENRKSAGTATLVTANATVANVFDTYVGGTLSAGLVNFTVSGASTIRASTTVTSTSGTLAFAAVTNAGSLGSSSGPITMTSLSNSGTLGLGAESTSTASITSSGTIRLNGETLNVGGNWTDTGTLTPIGGGVKFNGAGAQSIGTEANFYNFGVNKSAGIATLTGHVTTTNFLMTAGTLAVVDKIFYAPGNYANGGLVTRTTGKIKHTADYENFVNSSGVTQTAYTTPGTIYFEVKDANRNMNGAAADTLTVPVSVNAGAGGDAETITLTETGLATGIFRSGAIGFYTGTSIVLGNGEIVISATGIGTETYTDNQDAADTGATTATLTYSGVVASPGGGGGGGGGGLPPVTTTYQSESSDPNRTTYLNNLSSMGLPVNSLVKLPDDGNGATQEDSAVYYIGSDGKRHAFPNSKIYFTWYKDFSGVRIITADQLASIPLGTNVRYKPGSRMVKFTTDPKVYAVDVNGVLRWVKTEAAAKALYGDNWNTFIDDLSDAFFSNYSFGKDVETAADFNVNQALGLEQTISDNLKKA